MRRLFSQGMESISSLTKDRLFKWQANRRMKTQGSDLVHELSRRMRVKRIFDMKTLEEIETHDALWTVLKSRPGWSRQEKEGQMDYLFVSDTNTGAKASLPTNLSSASPDVLQNFVKIVNMCEPVDIFAVWEIFKVLPVPPNNSLTSYHEQSGSPSTSSSKHVRYELGHPSEAEYEGVLPKQVHHNGTEEARFPLRHLVKSS